MQKQAKNGSDYPLTVSVPVAGKLLGIGFQRSVFTLRLPTISDAIPTRTTSRDDDPVDPATRESKRNGTLG